MPLFLSLLTINVLKVGSVLTLELPAINSPYSLLSYSEERVHIFLLQSVNSERTKLYAALVNSHYNCVANIKKNNGHLGGRD